MTYNAEDVRVYVPKWNENREKPEAEQMSAELAPMTGGELRAAQRASIGKDGKVSLKAAEAAIEKIIKARVVARGEQSLIDELYNAITEISTLSEGLRKK